MFVTAQAAGSGNDPNKGNSFVKTARIDRAVSTTATGPYTCVQENILNVTKGFAGNPQVFKTYDGKLLLAVIGMPCAVYASATGGVEGPWVCASPGQSVPVSVRQCPSVSVTRTVKMHHQEGLAASFRHCLFITTAALDGTASDETARLEALAFVY